MLPSIDEFRKRADAVRLRIARACALAHRDASGVEILAVTKSHPAGAVDLAAQYGRRTGGENRGQEGVEKRARRSAPAPGELTGPRQSNKAPLAVRHFDRIQSVDSVKLLEILDRVAGEMGKTQAVLLQVNA